MRANIFGIKAAAVRCFVNVTAVARHSTTVIGLIAGECRRSNAHTHAFYRATHLRRAKYLHSSAHARRTPRARIRYFIYRRVIEMLRVVRACSVRACVCV